MTSLERYRALAESAKEIASKASEGPWVSGYWSGQCKMDHKHDRWACVYEFTLRTDNDTSHHSISKAFDEGITVVCTTDEYGALSKCDSIFIAESRTLVPEMADAIEELIKALEKCQGKP